MTNETLRSWILRQPFQPFEIRMSNGQGYAVQHPEYAALGKTNIIVFYPDSDRYAELSLLHVASVERLETAEQSA